MRKAALIALGFSVTAWLSLGAIAFTLAIRDGDHLPVHVTQPLFDLFTITTVLSGTALIVEIALERNRKTALIEVQRTLSKPVAWYHADWPTAGIPRQIGQAAVPASAAEVIEPAATPRATDVSDLKQRLTDRVRRTRRLAAVDDEWDD